MSESTLIKNVRIVNEGTVAEADVLIEQGRIARITAAGSASNGHEVFDANGAFLLPGMIDDQVHFREPGLTHKGSIASESRAAVAGGITSFMDMPNTRPPTVTLDALEDKYSRAAATSAANYAFYLGATNDNLEVIKSLPDGVACGIKVFMGSSTGNMLVDNQETLAGIFREARTIIATHCESTPRIEERLKVKLAEYGEQIPVTEHPWIRDAEACLQSSTMAVGLAREFGSHLHILHLTTAEEMDLLESGPVEGKNITGEVCVHFLRFTSEDYPRMGNRIKCNPAIKAPRHQAGLMQAMKDGRINILATDHAPHTLEEKAEAAYTRAPAGLPLVQDALLCALELVHEGNFELADIVAMTSHNVARRFGVVDRGFIREGYWADLVLVDMQNPTPVTQERTLYKCGWSPFEGERFSSSLRATWVSGALACLDGRLVEHDSAMRLRFAPVR